MFPAFVRNSKCSLFLRVTSLFVFRRVALVDRPPRIGAPVARAELRGLCRRSSWTPQASRLSSRSLEAGLLFSRRLPGGGAHRAPRPVGRHMGSNARERPRVNGGLPQCGDTPRGRHVRTPAPTRWPSLRGDARRHLVSPGVGARVLSTGSDSAHSGKRRPAGYVRRHPASARPSPYCPVEASPASTHTRSSSANPAYASHT